MWNSRQVAESPPATTGPESYLDTPRNTPRKWNRLVRCGRAVKQVGRGLVVAIGEPAKTGGLYMKSVPRVGASKSLSMRTAGCMKADIAQTDGAMERNRAPRD
ncbi:unnamed protein product [Sphagnum tenellum]